MITLTAQITLAHGNTYEVDNRNMLYTEGEILDRADISTPSVGVISNKAKLNFVDYDKTIENWIKQGNITNKLTVRFYLKNTLAEVVGLVGEYYAENWNYDTNNRNVSVALSDGLEEWQNIKGIKLLLADKINGLYIYDFLVNRSNDIWDFEDLDDKTYEILSNYYIEYPYFEATNLWAAWNKLCEACGLHLYKNRNNKITVSYEFRS